jgi:hypothetical protein
MRPSSVAAAAVFALVALAHLLRLLLSVPVLAGGIEIPMWTSVLGVIGSLLLAGWLWRERRA